MIRIQQVSLAVVATLVLLLPAAGVRARADEPEPAGGKPERPNLVFVLLDNLGKEWFGAYGSEEGVTPNIDRLAEAGVRIENCYTPTVCGPSRITALTGRYLLRSGLTLHHDAALYSGGGLDPGREVTFARPLREAGYATGMFGKWQINNLYDEPEVITRHGFDEYLLWPGSLDRDKVSRAEYDHFMERVLANDFAFTREMISKIESRYWDVVTLDHRRQRTVHRGRFGPDVFQEAAYDFIRRHRDRPFLLYLPSPLTHGWTFTDPVTYTPLNMDPDRPHREMYRDMIRYADLLVGQLVEELRRQGVDAAYTDGDLGRRISFREFRKNNHAVFAMLVSAVIVDDPEEAEPKTEQPEADEKNAVTSKDDGTASTLPGT